MATRCLRVGCACMLLLAHFLVDQAAGTKLLQSAHNAGVDHLSTAQQISPSAAVLADAWGKSITVSKLRDTVIGHYHWTWNVAAKSTSPPNTNLGVAFSGWVNPSKAISDSLAVYDKLLGAKYICLGGGDSDGRWTLPAVKAVIRAIKRNSFSAYKGIVFDIEEGNAGLAAKFAVAFAAAKRKHHKVIVTISHSQPYGFPDAVSLMHGFFSDHNIDYISPQLYTSGTETANDFSATNKVPWTAYARSKAKVVPSIVDGSMYSDAQSAFAGWGVETAGYIQWKQVSKKVAACL